MNLITLLTFLPPVLFIITSILSRLFSEGKTKGIINLTKISAILSIIIAIAGGLYVYSSGTTKISFFELEGLGITFRLDALSMIFFGMIALLGFIIVKYSVNYLEGDSRRDVFMGRISATIASVQLFVISGNLLVLFLTWVLTSLFLHRLLIFYRDRRRAIIAARKKFIVARIADVFLLISFILLYNQMATGDLETIFSAINLNSIGSMPLNIEIAAVFLVLAALFKSAQFPTHGWLVEVMETPTPVSALLHAGLLNAGPFIIMRFAFMMNQTEIASSLLLFVGGFTALFASIVFMTQSSIKTALGYSSIAHMGFSFFICGTGAYSAAVLHIVAHSFYKGHAFLSSGSSVDLIRAKRIAVPQRLKNPLRILSGVVLALAIYVAVATIFGLNITENLSLLAVGLIIVLSLSQFLIPVIDSKQRISTVLTACLFAGLVSVAFFSFESLFNTLLAGQLPESAHLTVIELSLIGLMLLLFTTAVFIQLINPDYFSKTNASKISVHLRNGLYINTYFDKLIGAYKVKSISK